MAANSADSYPYRKVKAFDEDFFIDKKFQFVREIQRGAHGLVVATKQGSTGEGRAVKIFSDVGTKVICQVPQCPDHFDGSHLFFDSGLSVAGER